MNEQTLEELVDSYNKAKATIEEMEAAQQVVKDSILDYLTALKITGTKTKNGYYVKKVSSTIFSGVSMSTARDLGCVIVEEKLDTGKLRKLKDNDVPIPGARVITYVKIEEEKK